MSFDFIQGANHPLYASRLQRINAIKDFLQSKNPLMLIVGEKGGGKASLITDIILQMRLSRHVIRLQGHPNLQPSRLTEVLSKHWKIEHVDKSQRIETQLDQMLNALTENNQPCILAVDNAHLLSLSALAALTHLATRQDGHRVHLYLLLSGQPSLSEKMKSLQAKNILQLTTDTLSYENASQRIKSLLDKAEISLPHSAENEILTRIYQDSDGMMNRIKPRVEKLIVQQAALNSIATETPIATTEKPELAAVINPFWKNHRVKTIALAGLLLTGIVAWKVQHHPTTKLLTWSKNTIQYTDTRLKPQPKKQIAQSKPSQFTLQLMSGTNKPALQKFIKKHHFESIAKIVKIKNKGHTWYTLTYGQYQTLTAAKKALKHLPKSAQHLHPWIRPNSTL